MTAKSYFTYAAIALLAGSLLHIVGLLLGPDAILFLGAPESLVAEARNGDWVHMVSITLAIAALLAGLAWLSWRTRPPQVSGKVIRFVLIAFATIFTIRGIFAFLFIPAYFRGVHTEDPTKFFFHAFASLFVLSIGFALTQGLVKTAGRKSQE